jgi:hypothetical protein
VWRGGLHGLWIQRFATWMHECVLVPFDGSSPQAHNHIKSDNQGEGGRLGA